MVAAQFRMGKDLLLQRAHWYSRKKNITFSDMLAAARHSHFEQGISDDHGKCQIILRRSTCLVQHANTDSEKKRNYC